MKGYRDFSRYEEVIARTAEGWEAIEMFYMEDRCTLAILERMEHA